MTTVPPFQQVLGQTEKALNAILDRELAGTGLAEPQWVALTLSVASSGHVDHNRLVARVADALKVSDAQAGARIAELADAQLVTTPGDEGTPVTVTPAGQQLYGRIRSAVTAVTERMWGDLPADDLATATRVLSTVLARANAELRRE
jgi:hypothetical protein